MGGESTWGGCFSASGRALSQSLIAVVKYTFTDAADGSFLNGLIVSGFCSSFASSLHHSPLPYTQRIFVLSFPFFRLLFQGGKWREEVQLMANTVCKEGKPVLLRNPSVRIYPFPLWCLSYCPAKVLAVCHYSNFYPPLLHYSLASCLFDSGHSKSIPWHGCLYSTAGANQDKTKGY